MLSRTGAGSRGPFWRLEPAAELDQENQGTGRDQSGAGRERERESFVRQSAGDPESEIRVKGRGGVRWKCNGEVHGTEESAESREERRAIGRGRLGGKRKEGGREYHG